MTTTTSAMSAFWAAHAATPRDASGRMTALTPEFKAAAAAVAALPGTPGGTPAVVGWADEDYE